MKGITSNPALDAYQRMAISPVGAARPGQKAASPADVGTTSTPQVAKVTISSEARELAVGAAQGPSDPEKVAKLRAQVEAGSFQVDSHHVAKRLVAALG